MTKDTTFVGGDHVMKNVVILILFTGFMYVLGSTIVQISRMNADKAARIILGTNKGPFLDEKRVKQFVESFEGKKQ